MKKTLRLLVTEKCNKKCEKCCNKTAEINTLSGADHFKYEEIIITGGEPMLNPNIVMDFIKLLRSSTQAKIILYSADPNALLYRHLLDGITLSIHENDNKLAWMMKYNKCSFMLEDQRNINNSVRIYNFNKQISKDIFNYKCVDYKDMEYKEHCPIGKNEVFKKLILF